MPRSARSRHQARPDTQRRDREVLVDDQHQRPASAVVGVAAEQRILSRVSVESGLQKCSSQRCKQIAGPRVLR